MTFEDVVMECWGNDEFVRQFNRLAGTHLKETKRAPIEMLIDNATGYEPGMDDAEAHKFFAFVKDMVWDRL